LSLPAIQTDLTTDDDLDLPVSAELLLTLKPGEVEDQRLSRNGKATLFKWVSVLESVRQGYTFRIAAAEAGIAYRTLKLWMEKGRQGLHPYVELVDAIEIARASSEKQHLDVVFHNALVKKNWLPAAWFLERTRPETYSRRTHVKTDEEKPKAFTLIIDQSGKIAERIGEMDDQKAIEVESRAADD